MEKSRWGMAGAMLLLCALAGTAWSSAFAADPVNGTTTGAPSTGAPSTGAPSTGAPSTGAPSTGAPSKDLSNDTVNITPIPSSGRAPTTGYGLAVFNPQTIPPEEVVRKSRTIAAQLARDYWFDKMADANPRLVAAVCSHPRAATILAAHVHLAEIADADHLLCRRLTRWHSATEVLLRNADCDRVIQLDPQGMYWAIERRPAYARVLAGHVLFYKMMSDNPDLGRVVAQHMW